VSRDAFVADVVAVVEELADGPVRLVGQSMGAHTAFLAASSRPDLVDRLVLLEGHVAGDDDPDAARRLGEFFDSWPVPFTDEAVVEAVHGPRWHEWENLTTPTLAVFADGGRFTAAAKDELVRRRPGTRRADLADAGHDAHLDAFDAWIGVLRDDLGRDVEGAST
jgi:pimeloyl-ACP methyl ester carboxylesterase